MNAGAVSVMLPNPIGLNGGTNGCWLETSIQALASLKHIVTNVNMLAIVNNPGCKNTALNLVRVLKNLQSGTDPTQNIHALHNASTQILDPTAITAQCMSTEFIEKFIDAAWVDKPDNRNFLREAFYIKGSRRYTCSCGESVEKDDISLAYRFPAMSLPKDSVEFTRTLLRTSQIIQWHCQRCKITKSATEEWSLKNIGDIIMIHTPNSYNRDAKTVTNIPVHAPLMLRIPVKINGSVCDRVMHMRAAVVYSGSGSGGHYFALVCRGDNWFAADGRSITPRGPPTLADNVVTFFYGRD